MPGVEKYNTLLPDINFYLFKKQMQTYARKQGSVVNSVPNIRLLVPANHETNWSDLLGSMIETDPAPMLQVLGAKETGQLHVTREFSVVRKCEDGKKTLRDQVDLVLTSSSDNRPLAVIEIKVLAPVGSDQLERYAQSIDAKLYCLLQLKSFQITPSDSNWESLTWEDVLRAYTDSNNIWVATTAKAWLGQLATLVPHVDGTTVWNDVRDGAEGDLDLKARGAWLYSRMESWCELDFDFSAASKGRSWVVEMSKSTSLEGYSVEIELEEGLPIQQWNDPNSELSRAERLKGPVVLIGLVQNNIENPHSFDWQLLARLFQDRVLDAQGKPKDGRKWRKGGAKREHLEGWMKYVSNVPSMPNWVGQGYDMSKSGKWCLFGGRFNLSPGLSLDEVERELKKTAQLIEEFAAIVSQSQ